MLLPEYRATAPTLTEKQNFAPQIDVNGNQKVTDATLSAGENLPDDVQRTEEKWSSTAISTATTTTIKTGVGVIGGIEILGGTLGAITVYDNTAASGTAIAPAFTPTGTVPIAPILKGAIFSVGLTVVTGAATVVVVKYR